MPRTFGRFCAARRSAVAIIMAVSLAPLILLVGIAIDFTFLAQSRSQSAFASEAAATQAIRIAAATYSLEVAHGNDPTDAALRSIKAANNAGNLWFAAELGNLIRSSPKTASTSTTYDGTTSGAVVTTAPPNFTATVTDSASYPPIFNPLFGAATPWVYSTAATATTQFSYAEILLLLDTSGSMLIGADQSDILTMEEGTVCPQQNTILASDPGGVVSGAHELNYPVNAASGPVGEIIAGNVPSTGYAYDDNSTTADEGDGDKVPFSALTAVYSDPSQSDTYYTGPCVTGSPNYGISPSNVDGAGGATASAPCALACHFTLNKSATGINSGLYADYYGLARGEGVQLRIDAVFSATEQVIQDMETNQAVTGQLSVGVYQFNVDVGAIVNGSTGAGATLPEATPDLGAALTAVDAVDYKKTPGETAIPQLINNSTGYNPAATPPTAPTGGDTNLPLSMSDLAAGTAFPESNSSLQKLGASGAGGTSTTPQKFLFLVTDGMEDDGLYPNTTEGDMTSISGEVAGTGTCSYIKNTLGITIYVLYVTYYPVADGAYYQSPTPGLRYTNSATNADFPSDKNASVRNLTEDETQAQSAATRYSNSPTALALKACASTTNGTVDFYQATSSSDIQTALNQMLKAALASTIRLTN